MSGLGADFLPLSALQLSPEIFAKRDTANRDTEDMEAFKGKYERTSADKYEELLKVGIRF